MSVAASVSLLMYGVFTIHHLLPPEPWCPSFSEHCNVSEPVSEQLHGPSYRPAIAIKALWRLLTSPLARPSWPPPPGCTLHVLPAALRRFRCQWQNAAQFSSPAKSLANKAEEVI